ncbi:MAG TPA: DUF6438 domain-containing protein [Bacteroidia bacterium]|nr:DUF6438 domain-containing protein [Bacteroidia bacterium]HNU32059.1 DUF6438 domain-containing protein [Bacteroidia bacterium]
MTKHILFLAVIVSSFSFCKTKNKAQTSSFGPDSLAVSIYKYPCFGRCPYYEAKIYSSGYALFDGKRDTKNIGLYETTFSKKEVEELLNEAKSINYMSLPDSFYNPGLADFPAVITSVKLNGKRKTVYNCLPDAPDELKKFQQRLDEFFTNESSQWRLLKAKQED